MSDVKIMTFDLYGTLVDWKSSIGNVLNLINPGLLDKFFSAEFVYVSNLKSFEPYSMVLKKTLMDVLKKNGIQYEEDYGETLVRMFSKSPFFADSVLGLIRIKKKFKVGVISNTERKLVKVTLAGMEDLFDYIITAEDTKFYKPDRMAFLEAIKIMNVKEEEILHISAYPQYDLKPARALGIRSVLLNRYGYHWDLEINSLDKIFSII
ncbi:MAG: HAD-IA family hydrolase [Nitrososphaeria archaeon]|nr:HAD-IA family hydrolase [Conexivisphaerales archaeon]